MCLKSLRNIPKDGHLKLDFNYFLWKSDQVVMAVTKHIMTLMKEQKN